MKLVEVVLRRSGTLLQVELRQVCTCMLVLELDTQEVVRMADMQGRAAAPGTAAGGPGTVVVVPKMVGKMHRPAVVGGKEH
jgi:hypothetical protein